MVEDPLDVEPLVEGDDPGLSVEGLGAAEGSEDEAPELLLLLPSPLLLSGAVTLELSGDEAGGVAVDVDDEDEDDDDDDDPLGVVDEADGSLVEGAAAPSGDEAALLPDVEADPSTGESDGLASPDTASAGPPAGPPADLSSGLAASTAASAGLSSGFTSSVLAGSVFTSSDFASSGFASVAAAGVSVLASSGCAAVAAAGASVATGAVSLVGAGVSALGATAAGVAPVSFARSAAMISSIFVNASSATTEPATLPSSSETFAVSSLTCSVAASRAN